MSDIFKDMQTKVGCEYLSDLPSYKRKVWQEMKRLNPADYEERQLEDFSKYVFGMSYQTLQDVMKQQKGREEQAGNRVLVETKGTTGEETTSYVRFDADRYDVCRSLKKVRCRARSGITALSKRYCPLLMKSTNIQACTSSTN